MYRKLAKMLMKADQQRRERQNEGRKEKKGKQKVMILGLGWDTPPVDSMINEKLLPRQMYALCNCPE